MAGRAHPSRDLRLGLYAFEQGAIDRNQLVAVIKEWTSVPDRPLAALLADHGGIDEAVLARLLERVASDLDAMDALDPGATVAYVGRNATAGPSESPVGAGHVDDPALLGGRFQVVGVHGRGGLGEVSIAFDRELNRSVALKELRAGLAHDPSAQARFVREAEVTGRLEHPGIVPVYSLGRHGDGRPYYAMHLVQGETLRSEIERFHRKPAGTDGSQGRALAFRRLLRSLIDACNAVAYAHSHGVIHRDLKPENIMIGQFGQTLVVDWGLAKYMTDHVPEASPAVSSTIAALDASMTQPGSLLGTPRYMSPEQAAGEVDRIGPATDVYSLGAILYCMLVGTDPFADGDLQSVLDRVSRGIFPAPRRLLRSADPGLEVICLKAMSRSADHRHATALELASAIESWLADIRYRGEHEDALRQVKGSLARLCLERAHASFDKEKPGEGMLWLARALANAPAKPADLERVIRTSLTAWHTGAKLLERSLRHGSAVHCLAFCPEGRRLTTAGEDGQARLWDLATGNMLAPPLAHEGPVHGIALSPDGTTVATAAGDGTIRLWDAWTGEPRGEPTRARVVGALSFSPDSSRFAVACGPDEFFLRHTATGRGIGGPARSARPVLAIAFAPDGLTVATAHDDGTVCVRDPDSGAALGQPLAHSSAIRTLAFDNSGTRLLTGSAGGEARHWDLATRTVVAIVVQKSAIRSIAFRPGAAGFATVDDDGNARLWDATTGQPIGESLVHRAAVLCLGFRPDGTIVATGCAHGTVRLWCAVTGLPIGPPFLQGGAVRSLAFSADGRRLASAGTDPTIRCWKMPAPLEGNPERVITWVGVTTELEFDAGDAIRPMDMTTSWELRRRLGEQGGAPLR
jgi:WD40 repeat protein/serine/threonine protein kinase